MPQSPIKSIIPIQTPSLDFLKPLWEKLFGDSIITPEIQKGIDLAHKELPDLDRVQTYGPLSRLLMGNAVGYTSPARNIYLNSNKLQGFSPEDIADTLVHEQQHVRQMNKRNLGPIQEFFHSLTTEPYHQRPDEMEAYAVEDARRRKQRRTGAIPNFETGEFYTPTDIRLR